MALLFAQSELGRYTETEFEWKAGSTQSGMLYVSWPAREVYIDDDEYMD